MVDRPSRDPRSDSKSDAFEIDSICNAFESELRSGGQPAIEEYLNRISESRRGDLLTKLIQIELWWKRDDHSKPEPEIYKARFPEFASAVDAGFAAYHARSSASNRDSLEETLGSGQATPVRTQSPTHDPGMETLSQTLDSPSARQEQPSSFDAKMTPLPAEVDSLRISEMRKRFEEAWTSSASEPKIEEFVPHEMESGDRLVLVRELVSVDIQYRKQKNKSLSAEAYHSRFPDCRIAIDHAFSNDRPSDSPHFGGETVGMHGAPNQHRHSVSIHADDPSCRYRPTKLHARGGLGAVYRAEDKELKRMVALKEILPEHAGNQYHRDKFVFEAEITGSLEHPGIVPVYGLGRYADDQPYYAMRFIRGSSFRKAIDEFHKQNPSPSPGTYYKREFRALLRRFIETCNAIHYAHQHGVVHRDIKPDNIMLGDYGETLVVDWGLAKVIDAAADGESEVPMSDRPGLSGSGSQTRYGSVIGTPMYMSPEQAAGKHDELDGRSDVYSLGGVLFNIVSGKHSIDGKNLSEVITNITLGKIKPLDSVAPSAPRALASICRKAMATSPNDRYATAIELADDLDRWLSDEMVIAHQGNERSLEKAGRLIRRYRSWTISGALSLLVITVIATVAAFFINHAKNEERIAKQQATEFKHEAVERYRDSRDAIDTWLVQSSDALEYFPETQAVRQHLLQLAIEDYGKLANRESRDPELELERGRALIRLGDLARMQQDYESARAHYDEALRIIDLETNDSVIADRLGDERGNIATRTGIALASEERNTEAEEAFHLAIITLSPREGVTLAPETRRLLAAAYVNLGELQSRIQRRTEAVATLEQAIQLYQSPDMQSDEAALLGLARARELAGRVYTQLRDHEKAIACFQDSIDELQVLVTVQPDHPEFLDALASVCISESANFRMRGLETEQLLALELSIRHYRSLCSALPGIPRYEEHLAITLTDLGLTLYESGRNSEAETSLLEAQEILGRLASSYPQIPRFREELATSMDALGQVYLDWNPDVNLAMEQLAGAVTTYRDLAQEAGDRPDYVERLAIAQSHYAQSLWRGDDIPSARQYFEAAISVLQQLLELVGDLPEYSTALSHVHQEYAAMLHAIDDDDSLSHFEQARDMWIRLDQRRTATDAYELSWLLATCPIDSVRDVPEAQRYAKEALDYSPENSTFLSMLALTHLKNGQPDEAKQLLQEAISKRGNPIDRDLYIRSMIQRLDGDTAAADQSLQQGDAWMNANRPYDRDLLRLRAIAQQPAQ